MFQQPFHFYQHHLQQTAAVVAQSSEAGKKVLYSAFHSILSSRGPFTFHFSSYIVQSIPIKLQEHNRVLFWSHLVYNCCTSAGMKEVTSSYVDTSKYKIVHWLHQYGQFLNIHAKQMTFSGHTNEVSFFNEISIFLLR